LPKRCPGAGRCERLRMNRTIKVLGITVLAASASAALAYLIVRDQIDRHRRELFSSSTRRRLASLGHLSAAEASVDNITLLRDFVAREPKKLLRNRARVILGRMESQAGEGRIRDRSLD
jgi:hypothetical protein